MKTFSIAGIIGLALLQSACGTDSTPQDDLTDFHVTSPQAETIEGDFTYRLITEKEQYTEGENVEVYAELEYTGELESIEISHAASPFHFPIYEETRNYSVAYAMNEPLLITVLTKGVPIKEYYSGSGGYSTEDDDAYIEFVQHISDNKFPFGYYKMSGYADFFIENTDDSKTFYNLNALIDFKVSK
ncbi:hypothetical protein B481_2945 [Planococcus halocryophilus Or1]|uniref:Uncharacterized protein n=1 Tax=Planococcus halocryophilus TaxID=1215089 RepID=A0A1C7DUD2_9BACL|nr:hypothetical protein [Planococcus halocryophilus]ANU15017.1 hypothetical protein BBI08_14650 [Planococcus halocryophilus]EMF45698.1 hypothetical protein B481_2945 [Planococcus halocryophilus Or1]